MSSKEYCIEHTVILPPESHIATLYDGAYLADAYAITLPPNASRDPKDIALFMFSQQKSWIGKLMGVRDYIVGFLGLKTAKKLMITPPEDSTERVHFFKIYQQFNNEIILGEDDKHLDFRISVLIRPQITDKENLFELVVTTVVHCHNLLGRAYIKVIKPFHKRVVQSTIRQAARIGWPLA